MRGGTRVSVIVPKAPAVTRMFGSAKLTVFSTLKISVLNSNRWLPKLKLLKIQELELQHLRDILQQMKARQPEPGYSYPYSYP